MDMYEKLKPLLDKDESANDITDRYGRFVTSYSLRLAREILVGLMANRNKELTAWEVLEMLNNDITNLEA